MAERHYTSPKPTPPSATPSSTTLLTPITAIYLSIYHLALQPRPSPPPLPTSSAPIPSLTILSTISLPSNQPWRQETNPQPMFWQPYVIYQDKLPIGSPEASHTPSPGTDIRCSYIIILQVDEIIISLMQEMSQKKKRD